MAAYSACDDELLTNENEKGRRPALINEKGRRPDFNENENENEQ